MKFDKFKKILLLLVLLDFLIVLAGGYYYFSKNYSGMEVTALALNNCFEALLMEQQLTVKDLVEDVVFWEGLSGFGRILMWAYSVALIVSPLISLLIALSVLDEFLHFFAGFTNKKNRVLVVGYNEQIRTILLEKNKDSKIYLWSEMIVPEEEEKELTYNGISVITRGFNLGDDKKEYDEQKIKFNKFLKKKKITHVLLMDDKDTKNIQYYMALSTCDICDERTIHFYVITNEFENRKALQDYFDNRLEEKLKKQKNELGKRFDNTVNDSAAGNGPDVKDKKAAYIKAEMKKYNTHMDISIFNFYQIQARHIYKYLPVHNGKNNIHLFIVGGGYLGEYLVLHAMNQGIATPDNEIIIDIVDKDISWLKRKLQSRFNLDYIEHTEENEYRKNQDSDVEKASDDVSKVEVFSISKEKADGRFILRLHQADVYSEEFEEILKNYSCEEKGGDYTYMACAMTDEDTNFYAAMEMKKIMKNAIPLALRMSYSDEMKSLLKQPDPISGGAYPEVFFIGTGVDFFNINTIIDEKEEKAVRTYNARYNSLTGSMVYGENDKVPVAEENKDSNWNGLRYYKRQSNRALFFHSTVKKCIYRGLSSSEKDELKKELDRFWNSEVIVSENSSKEEAWSQKLIEKNKSNNKAAETDMFPVLVAQAKTEHRRFCYFYASEGWGIGPKKIEATLTHDCLVTWDDLLKKRQNTLIYDLISLSTVVESVDNETSK